MKYWVTMTDRFCWSKTEGFISKFVVECDTYEQAKQIKNAANRQKYISHINIRTTKPYYNRNRYAVSMRHYDNLGAIWKK